MNITPEKLDELIRIVHLAGVEIIKIYKKKVTKKYKSDNTPVTNADIKANDIDAAKKIVEGTARSMGVEIKG